jgi:hypothetical protein
MYLNLINMAEEAKMALLMLVVGLLTIATGKIWKK